MSVLGNAFSSQPAYHSASSPCPAVQGLKSSQKEELRSFWSISQAYVHPGHVLGLAHFQTCVGLFQTGCSPTHLVAPSSFSDFWVSLLFPDCLSLGCRSYLFAFKYFNNFSLSNFLNCESILFAGIYKGYHLREFFKGSSERGKQNSP